MITTVPKPVKLWGRGQLTVPKDVRQAMKDESQGAELRGCVAGPEG